ncbi:hypothetical protein M501DRAFT_1013551 [Patellaria atrata CBS 101060]|uniref:Uncharacterized protein n=1 Tax=Patellaria atrata CBS 101060 TaxID=1346257 RepID=A0A9P4SGQ2_9PEZI|nr:hypothetical protein M501DRAFT_1013551 [Patellaria atrata CBS 101060]
MNTGDRGEARWPLPETNEVYTFGRRDTTEFLRESVEDLTDIHTTTFSHSNVENSTSAQTHTFTGDKSRTYFSTAENTSSVQSHGPVEEINKAYITSKVGTSTDDEQKSPVQQIREVHVTSATETSDNDNIHTHVKEVSEARLSSTTQSSFNEKKGPVEEVREVKGPSDVESATSEPAWTPGVWNQFPWIGAAGLLLVLVGMSCAVVILCVSNGKQVKKWPIEGRTVAPNVLVNLVNQISNLGLVTAIGQGIAIAWWRKAMRGGTIETLHRNHNYSMSFMSVLLSGKNFNLVALAVLMTKFAIIDSTLFQRSTQATVNFNGNVSPNHEMVAWVDSNWSANYGGFTGFDNETKAVNGIYAEIIDAYSTHIGLGKVHDDRKSFEGCPAGLACKGNLDTMGFSFDCSTEIEDVDYGRAYYEQYWPLSDNSTADYPVNMLWNVEFAPVYSTESSNENETAGAIRLVMEYVSSDYEENPAPVEDSENPPPSFCPGILTRRVCTITPAVVSYPLTVLTASEKAPFQATHLQFNEKKGYGFAEDLTANQIDGIKVIKRDDLYEDPSFEMSTVAAIAFSLNNLYGSTASITQNRSQNGWDLAVDGYSQSMFFADDWKKVIKTCDYNLDYTSETPSPDDIPDPLIDMLRNVNSFAFVAAMYISGSPAATPEARTAANGRYPSKSFPVTVSGYVEMYETDFRFMAGAIAATVLTILLVLPVFWGFWQLGRKVSLAPFEIANAFGAPIFHGANTKNGAFEDLLGEVGDRRVQYGQLLHGEKPGVLGIAEPHRVARPAKRGSGKMGADELSGRVGVGAALGAAVAGTAAIGGIGKQ